MRLGAQYRSSLQAFLPNLFTLTTLCAGLDVSGVGSCQVTLVPNQCSGGSGTISTPRKNHIRHLFVKWFIVRIWILTIWILNVWYSNGQFMLYVLCTKPTIWIQDQYTRERDSAHFSVIFPPLFQLTKHSPSPSLQKASRNNPRPFFSNCLQNDVTLVRRCLTSFRTKTAVYYWYSNGIQIPDHLPYNLFLTIWIPN